MDTKVRLNQVKVGQSFKRSEAYLGTTVFKCLSTIKRSTFYKNEYYVTAEVVSTTGDYYKAGDVINVTSVVRDRKLGLVTLVN